MQQHDKDYTLLVRILEAVATVERYTEGKDQIAFVINGMLADACFMQMLVIGEAVGRVSDALKQAYQSIEWSKIKGMRNIYAHAYDYVNKEIVWQTIQGDLPVLKSEIDLIIKDLNNGKTN